MRADSEATHVELDPDLMAIFESVLGADVKLGPDDGPETIEKWDSVNHLNLILAIEAEFGVTFDTKEIPNLKTVGQIQAKLNEG